MDGFIYLDYLFICLFFSYYLLSKFKWRPLVAPTLKTTGLTHLIVEKYSLCSVTKGTHQSPRLLTTVTGRHLFRCLLWPCSVLVFCPFKAKYAVFWSFLETEPLFLGGMAGGGGDNLLSSALLKLGMRIIS